MGRGPLVGPVVTAAVILPKDFFLEGLTDSKKLSEKKREDFYKIIYDKAISVVLVLFLLLELMRLIYMKLQRKL